MMKESDLESLVRALNANASSQAEMIESMRADTGNVMALLTVCPKGGPHSWHGEQVVALTLSAFCCQCRTRIELLPGSVRMPEHNRQPLPCLAHSTLKGV